MAILAVALGLNPNSASAADLADASSASELITEQPTAGPEQLAPDVTDWTPAQAIAGLRANAVFTVPGSVAVMDEAAVETALSNSNIQILVLPQSGLDKEARDVHHEKSGEVQDWADENDLTLMVIDGLQIYLPPIYNLVPTDLGELQPVLLRHDVTSLVLSGIDRLVADADGSEYVDQRTDPVLETPGPADPALVNEIEKVWETSGLYVAPTVQTPIERTASWDIDLPTRVAVFPSLDRETALPALLAELQPQFPEDVLIVVHGEWIEVAGPQQELLDSALLELYGEYYTAMTEWGAPQAGLIRILIEKIGVWRSGVVADLAPPAAAPDPVNTVQPLLPWLFLLVALIIAVVVAVRLRSRQQRVAAAKTRGQHAFDRAGAEMAIVAHRLLHTGHLDPSTEAELARAAERYRTARDILQRNGSAQVAREALTSAREFLDQAGVPDIGTDPDSPADAAHEAGSARKAGSARRTGEANR